jgi:uncharacterized metal-binding protein YceD (DUF177 family)
MFSLAEHSIAFEGLKEQLYHYDYRLGQAFFEAMANDDLPAGDIHVDVELDKRSTMLVAEIAMKGSVNVLCDRCNADANIPVEGRLRQIFKLSEKESYDDEEVIALGSNEHEINLTGSMYECLLLALPARRVHEVGNCDPAVVSLLDEDSEEGEKKIDPRWNALRGMTG